MKKKYFTLMLGDIQACIEVQDSPYSVHNDSPFNGTTINVNEQIEPIMKISQYIVDSAKIASPSEVELNFGITVNAEGGFLCFAKAGVEAQFNITMTWKDTCVNES